MATRSAIWNFFTPNEENPDKSKCNTCQLEYSSKSGTTSSLINHLRSKHKDLFEKYEDVSKKRHGTTPRPSTSQSKQPKLDFFLPKNEEAVSKAFDDAMVDFLAEAGVAFRVAGLPSFKKMINIANKRIKVKHPMTYNRMVKTKSDAIKKDLVNILFVAKNELNCVGFTTDLWTSRSGNPFLSLTVHFISKDWKLYRFTPYVAPFPARHTGKNISLSLDAMVEELGLSGGDWELFAINDNAANVKLGIKLSLYLSQYLCDIHTLELAVKDCFKNTQGMSEVVKKCKAIGKFMHQSTEATKKVKNQAIKDKIVFKKVANPPNTRWSGHFDNLASVLHLKKPLTNILATYDEWAEHELTVSDWKLIEGAVELLKPVKDTVKAFEAEKEPTMHRVIERIYSMKSQIDAFIGKPSNNRYGIGFARELKKQIEVRFPDTGSQNKLRCFANFLAPQYKGIHLEAIGKLDTTKDNIKREVNRFNIDMEEESELNEGFIEDDAEDIPPLSPTSMLRKQMKARHQRTTTDNYLDNTLSPIDKEIKRFETFSIATKDVDILMWWKNHEHVLPLLSKLAKKVLTIPASSAKSERVFSCGGNFVSAKRNKLGSKKVEELILIKENQKQIDAFKEDFKEEFETLKESREPFRHISVDTVIAHLATEDDEEDMFVVDVLEPGEEEIIFINDISDVESEDGDSDELDIDIV